MTLSLKEWAEYRDLLSKLSQKASDEFKDAVWNVNGRWHGAGLGAIPRDDLIEYAHALVTKYSEGSSELACQMYDKIAKLSKKTLPPAEPAETASMQDVAKALNGTIKTSQNQDYVSSTVGRFVKQASQDTTLKNAKRDGAEFAWIPSGDPCPYCIMLAANGWRRVGKNGSTHADHIHNNCNCAYAVRFDSSTEIKGYDPDVYKEQYDEAEGRSSKDKVNSMRRIQYQENKDVINAQKREAYAERQQLKSEESSLNLMGQVIKEPISHFENGEEIIETYKVHQSDVAENIFTQTHSSNAQEMSAYIDKNVNNGTYGNVDKIVIAKNKDLNGIAAYNRKENALYISEEIIDPNQFDKIVDTDYFPARNVDDVLAHELDGHKQHWDAVDRYYKDNTDKFSDVMQAKNDLEKDLFKYVNKAQIENPRYIIDNISENAYDGFNDNKLENKLNELIADSRITCKDKYLSELIDKVIHYDGKSK